MACTEASFRGKTPSRPMAKVTRGANRKLLLMAPKVLHITTRDMTDRPSGPASLANICSAA